MEESYATVRADAPIWYMRFAQLFLAVVILGITGSTASDWHSFLAIRRRMSPSILPAYDIVLAVPSLADTVYRPP